VKVALLSATLLLILCGCGDADDAPKPPIVQTKSNQVMAQPESTVEGAPTSGDELGIAMYPNSKVLSKHSGDKTVQADIETPDPVEKAIAFYERQLSAKSDGKAPMTTIEGRKNGYHYVVVIAPKPGGTTAISILGEKA
jgi:hypothetical protein